MSTQIGTATDYVDLLAKLDAFLCATGHAWGKKFTGAGTGDLIDYLGTATSVAETFTLTASNATTFTVVGSVSGALANATVGTPYTSAKIAFTLTAGGTAYSTGDLWTINTAPPWQRLQRRGWADLRSISTTLATPANLFDGNNSTLATSISTSSTLDVTLQAASRVQRILLQAPSSTMTRMPTSIALQWRDNPGDGWTTAQTFTKASWTASETAVLTTAADPGEHLYWRLSMSGATTSTAIASLDLYHATEQGPLGDVSLNGFTCAWEAPGLDGGREIVCTVGTEGIQSDDVWNLAFGMSRSWVTDSSRTDVQPGFSGWRRMLLGTTPIGYWFVVNGQRAVVVTTFNGLMQIGYLGFGFPYEPPSVHAYPAIAAASAGAAGFRYSTTTNSGIRFPLDPGTSAPTSASTASMAAYFPDSAWRAFANRTNSGGSAEGAGETGSLVPGKVWPASLTTVSSQPEKFIENLDGSRSLIPCVLLATTGAAPHAWGEFDGLYWTTGVGAAPQAVISYEGFSHLIVNNIYRTSAQSFGAVRLD